MTVGGSRRRLAPNRTAGAVVVLVAALGSAGLAACGDDGPAPGAVASDAEEPATTVAVAEPPAFEIDPSVPDDPGDLPACDELDSPGDRQLPARWLPTSLPLGVDVATAGTTSRSAAPPPGSGLVVLVSTGAAGDPASAPGSDTVAAEVVVAFSPVDDPATAPHGFEPDTTLRGVPGQLGTSDGTGGPAGVVTARWVERGRDWVLEAAGLDEGEVVEVVERLELDDDVVDPAGAFRSIATAPGRYPALRTEVGLAVAGAQPREYGVVVEEHDGGTGVAMITGLVPRTGLELGELDGRPALRGTLGGTRVLMTTTPDGAAVYAHGDLEPDELDELVGSLERVDPDDERLVGVPMDWVPAEGRFCRDDR